MTDLPTRRDAILARLAAMARPGAVEAMARFGIPTGEGYGIPAAELRRLAREVGRDHELAEALWLVPNLDVRAFAALIEDPAAVDGAQMERWAASFDSWAVCDAAVYGVWRHSPLAPGKAAEWVARDEEFVKRAGFALMAGLAVVAKTAPDAMFAHFLELVPRHADDPRNFVKKAASWAVREIGKRRPALHGRAVELARELAGRPAASPGARWVGRDALRELTSAAVLARVAAARRAGRALGSAQK
jgi:3-methyladenine DNA glycosylase AlkD